MLGLDVDKCELAVPGPLYPDLFEREDTPIMAPGNAVCLGCGCTDTEACPDGCRWRSVNYDAGIGECSSCPDVYSGVIRNWECVTAGGRNQQYCRHCRSEKEWIIVGHEGRILVAIRACLWGCWS